MWSPSPQNNSTSERTSRTRHQIIVPPMNAVRRANVQCRNWRRELYHDVLNCSRVIVFTLGGNRSPNRQCSTKRSVPSMAKKCEIKTPLSRRGCRHVTLDGEIMLVKQTKLNQLPTPFAPDVTTSEKVSR